VAARTVLAVLRLLVSWAIRENLIKRSDNPASDMEKNLPKKRKKDRVLSLGEARIVWRAAGRIRYSRSVDAVDRLPGWRVGTRGLVVGRCEAAACCGRVRTPSN
jgi:integrase